MCRQFYRHCRDCHKMFAMVESDMRESCETFQKARILKPHLEKCPSREIPVIRPPSGHGGKLCEHCRKKNRNEQRERENAQKRARRAKLKRDKMTAGIGAGNVVWTAPSTWTSSVMDAPTLALHSPQPRRYKNLSVKSMTHALQYGPNGSIGTSKMEQNYVNNSQHERGIYSRSRQVFEATLSNIVEPQPRGNSHDEIATEMGDDAILHHQYKSLPHGLPTPMPDVPLDQEEKRQPIGLGITIPSDAKWDQSHTETCSFNEWSFRMELQKWSTVFEDDDDAEEN